MAQVAFPDQDNKWLLSHLMRGLQCYPSAQELSTVLFLDFCLPCFLLSLVSKAAFSKALFHVLEDTAHVVKYSKTGEMCMQLCRYSLCQFSSAICSFQTGRAQSQFSTSLKKYFSLIATFYSCIKTPILPVELQQTRS